LGAGARGGRQQRGLSCAVNFFFEFFVSRGSLPVRKVLHFHFFFPVDIAIPCAKMQHFFPRFPGEVIAWHLHIWD
jgi:hypothetical protein